MSNKDNIKDITTERKIRKKQYFNAIIEKAKQNGRMSTAVVNPVDEVSLMGAMQAYKEGIISPILFGNESKINELAKKNDLDLSTVAIEHVDGDEAAIAKKAILACRSGDVAILMKGKIHSDQLIRSVLDKENGIRTNRRLSHAFILDVPTYHKVLMITDAAVNIYPDLATKIDILNNAIEFAHSLGVELPKVALLSAIETVNAAFPSTVDYSVICKMAHRGQIVGALIDGPLALDNAVSMQSKKIKEIISDVAGDADILFVPNIEAGNMISKALVYLANADIAGIILGARIPIVLTSRADSVRSRIASAAIANIHTKMQKVN